MVLKPKDRFFIMKKMHNEIEHLGGARMYTKIKKQFFWHDRTYSIKKFVRTCDKCQLAKYIGNLRSEVEGMKNIHVCDLFYQITLYTPRPLLETSSDNKYVFVVIDHYSKWCEACPMKELDVITIARFLEEKIICQFGVPKYVLIDNGSEWMKEFDALC